MVEPVCYCEGELAFTSKEHAFSKKSVLDFVLLTSTVSGCEI